LVGLTSGFAARYGNASADARPKMHNDDTMPDSPIKAARCGRRPVRLLSGLALACALALGGCGKFSETFQRGYVLQEGSLEQIPIGATQEQVLIVLGTPSTVATVNGEAFYYISQKTQRGAAFMPQKVVDQRVIAVYFDKDRRVRRLANYGLKDGKIFDFVSQTTPTGGKERNFLGNLFKNLNPMALMNGQ
jgi:outer membrane protein assembly factor BamE (lipoprotein component of BamABCDE complex)